MVYIKLVTFKGSLSDCIPELMVVAVKRPQIFPPSVLSALSIWV